MHVILCNYYNNYFSTSQAGVPMQQPAYWAVPPGSNPAGAVPVSQAGAPGTQVHIESINY